MSTKNGNVVDKEEDIGENVSVGKVPTSDLNVEKVPVKKGKKEGNTN